MLEIFGIYSKFFNLKVEDASVFVGLNVPIDQHIVFTPVIKHDVPVYQHFGGARPMSDEFGVVISQIYSVLDPCVQAPVFHPLS